MLTKQLFARAAGLAVTAVLAAGTATPAAAQGGVNLVPWAGVYIPTSNSINALDQDISRDVSVIGGARLTFWGSSRLGFEVTGGYAPAKIGNETINQTGNTDLLVANARLLLALVPPTTGFGMYVGAGGGLLTRGSNPLDDDRSKTDLGGTVGLGFRFGSSHNSRVGLRLDLEDYLYNGDFGGGNDFQNDLVASLGLSIALGGRVDNE